MSEDGERAKKTGRGEEEEPRGLRRRGRNTITTTVSGSTANLCGFGWDTERPGCRPERRSRRVRNGMQCTVTDLLPWLSVAVVEGYGFVVCCNVRYTICTTKLNTM